jgi:hypothetical protein
MVFIVAKQNGSMFPAIYAGAFDSVVVSRQEQMQEQEHL